MSLRVFACRPAEFTGRRMHARGEHLALGAYVDRDEALYLYLDDRGVFALSSTIEGRALQGIAAADPLYEADEREMRDRRGVQLAGHPTALPSPVHDGVTQVIVGPVHAGIIEPGRFTFTTPGESVLHLDVQLGYAHRGVESFVEGFDPLAAAPKVARVCGTCSAARSFAYARALEELAGVHVPEQVDYARVVLAELERIYNHLHDIAASCAGAAWMPGFVRGMGLKEEAMRLNALACGHRLLFDAIVPGGVRAGVLAERAAVARDLDALEVRIDAYLQTVFTNVSVVDRFEGSGIVRNAAARSHGALGPAGRGSGVACDVRALVPYAAYATMAFVQALEGAGDVAARCAVKRAELRESFRLVRDALTTLGTAPLPPPATLSLASGTAAGVVEGPKGAELTSVRIGADGRIARLAIRSASLRNWPVVALAMHDNIIADFPLVNKSFNLCYACADR